jgi:alkanesulfonate monooxygenase SsuD/methylene tetrahydromethanopterin reductase-like flavin-dependent oxidoreductase (luciferase family)
MGPLPSIEEAQAHTFTEAEQTLVDEALSTHLIGDADSVQKGLQALVERTDAGEVMISTRIHSYEARLHSYELVAHRWVLEP